MKELNNDMKLGTFKRVYLFYGDESYLIHHYEDRLMKAVLPQGAEMMNFDKFEGKEALAAQIMDAAETLPFMNEHRLVLLKDTELFAAGRKNDSEELADYMKEIPESTILLFVESNVDKRNRLYKKVSEAGRAVEFKTPQEKELIDWAIKLFKKNGKNISSGCAAYLLRTVSDNMESLFTESEKLIAYKGSDTEIATEDIDIVCTKSLETKIFDLMGAIGNKNAETALDVYSNMLLMKESPIMILTMMARQFRLILQCGYMGAKGSSQSEIASRLGQRPFVVKECTGQSRNFKMKILLDAMNDCLQTDINIKTGKMPDRLAVETLIIKYCSTVG